MTTGGKCCGLSYFKGTSKSCLTYEGVGGKGKITKLAFGKNISRCENWRRVISEVEETKGTVTIAQI